MGMAQAVFLGFCKMFIMLLRMLMCCVTNRDLVVLMKQ